VISEAGWQGFVEVLLFVIEAELCLFEVEVERVFWNPVELDQAVLGEAPEALDTIDVAGTAAELILAVIDPEVLS
jgi:hypothetical protein